MSKKILLHLCCGPCGSASVPKLRADGFEPVALYYNPNIHPRSEYEKRRSEVERLAGIDGFEFFEENYNPDEYHEAVSGVEENKAERCMRCWSLRLEKTAKKAQELGIDTIGTSLRISPYQDQERLLAVLSDISEKYDLRFYDYPLAELYRDSVERSRALSMYRQKYCGCIYSKERR